MRHADLTLRFSAPCRWFRWGVVPAPAQALAVLAAASLLAAGVFLNGCSAGGEPRARGQTEYLTDEYYEERHDRQVNYVLVRQSPSQAERIRRQMAIDEDRYDGWWGGDKRRGAGKAYLKAARERKARLIKRDFVRIHVRQNNGRKRLADERAAEAAKAMRVFEGRISSLQGRGAELREEGRSEKHLRAQENYARLLSSGKITGVSQPRVEPGKSENDAGSAPPSDLAAVQ